MCVVDINDDGMVVAGGHARLVNLSEDDYDVVLAVVLDNLHLLHYVPCVELCDVVNFVLQEDIALLSRDSKRPFYNMLFEPPEVAIALSVFLNKGCAWNRILERLDVKLHF